MKNTTKKELTKEEIEELESISHENDSKPAPSYKLSSVKLNGKNGDYTKTLINSIGELQVDENGKAKLENLGKTIKGTILRSRIMFTSNEAEMEMFTNEADKGGKFSVLVKTITEKGSSISWAFSGNVGEVKQRYPELSYIQILYFLMEDTGEITRLKIKGKSLGSLFDYFKTFTHDEHIWEYVSELGYKAETNKFGKFFVSTIKRGGKVENISIIQNALREVNGKIQEIEKYYEEKEALRAQNEEVSVVDDTLKAQADAVQGGQAGEEPPITDGTPTIPIKTQQGVDDGEIDVKEIPFGGKNDGDPSNEELKEAGL